MLTERYLTRVGDFGHRANTAAEILGAVDEMRQALAHGWTESEGQRSFRTDVAACAALVGGGRLARVQADRR
jgi:roadblock/LC7 domain-containing protein